MYVIHTELKESIYRSISSKKIKQRKDAGRRKGGDYEKIV